MFLHKVTWVTWLGHLSTTRVRLYSALSPPVSPSLSFILLLSSMSYSWRYGGAGEESRRETSSLTKPHHPHPHPPSFTCREEEEEEKKFESIFIPGKGRGGEEE